MGPQPTMDRIYIHDLTADCIVGDLAWERETPQPIRCDLTLTYDLRRAGASDQLADTIDYSAVGAVARSHLEQSRCRMLEALAESLAAALLQRFPASHIGVTLWKQAHFPGAREVGVSIERP